MKKCIDKAAIGNILHKLWKKDTGYEHIDIARIAYNRALQDVQKAIDSKQEEPVSEDMKEASCAYARKEIIDPTFPNNEEFEISYSFEEGAKWQKAQMMAKAIEGGCFSYKNGFVHISCDIDEHLTDIKIGDKVKVIVIKED